MKKILLSIIAVLALTPAVKAWNGALHTAVAAIADANLTAEARKSIEAALDNHSIAYYAYWMEEVSDTEQYRHTENWHNVALTPKGKIIAAKKADKSDAGVVRRADALEGLSLAVAALQNRASLSKQEVADNIRFVVHIMGDLHCPSHYVFTDLLEERKIKYRYDKESKTRSYMKFWEGDVVHHTFGWKVNEFVHQLNRLSPEKVAELTKGSVCDWVTANAKVYRPIYSYIEPNQHLTAKTYRPWLNKSFEMATDQIGVAGYRLAALLNGLFDESAPKKSVK
ncbi:MAG: S1/P1 nuclease [Alistipes sp.]|nr:S1/P1 nuclease [Alistipes sp.]